MLPSSSRPQIPEKADEEGAIYKHSHSVLPDTHAEGYITSYLGIPGEIYGLPSNVLVDAGIQKENAI